MTKSKLFTPITHCIFDLDGLLLDTESVFDAVFADVCESYGKDYSLEVKLKVKGTSAEKSARTIIEELSLPVGLNEFRKEVKDLCLPRLSKLNLLPGAKKLIQHLHASNIPFCLATSSSREMGEYKIRGYPELFELFSHKVYGDDDKEVVHGKPSPDIFLVAASRFQDKPDPRKCLVFEDSVNGVRAGIAAGMQVVMVPDEIVNDEQREEATIALDSLENFQPEIFGLPKYCT